MTWTALVGAGVAAALCAVVVKQRSPELALLLALAACLVLLKGTLPYFETVRDRMEALAGEAGVDPALLAPVGKTVGLAVVTRLAASLCRDAGEESVAALVELAGSAAAVAAALPLLDMAADLLLSLL